MSSLHSVIAPFAACNLHLCLYADLGLILILQSIFAFRQHQYHAAREHGVHGLIYISLGML